MAGRALVTSAMCAAACALATAGCDLQTAQTDSSSSGGEDGGAFEGPAPGVSLEWRAQLTTTSSAYGIGGDAIVRMEVDDHVFRARVEIRNDAWGTTRPWHVRGGRCATGGPIVGEDAWYPRLITDGHGAATIIADIPVPLDPTGEYHIAVLRAEKSSDMPIACGTLRLE